MAQNTAEESKSRLTACVVVLAIAGMLYWSATSMVDYMTKAAMPAFDLLVRVPMWTLDGLGVKTFDTAMNILQTVRYVSIFVGFVAILIGLTAFLSLRKDAEHP